MQKIIFITILYFLISASNAVAVNFEINAPEKALSNRQEIVVSVSIDTSGQKISGIGGDFSFPSNLFKLEKIILEGGVVPLWIKQPTVLEEKYFDNRTHITFEGIFPGGYEGVLSPYYEGLKKGSVFSVVLKPKEKGNGVFLLDNLDIRSFDVNATKIKTESKSSIIVVPPLYGEFEEGDVVYKYLPKLSLDVFIGRDDSILNNSFYLTVHDKEQKASIENIFVAETDDYSPYLVPENKWKKTNNPYILFYQDRSKYIHIKIVYMDDTYTLRTIPPVENSNSISSFLSILIIISIVIFLLRTFYECFIKVHFVKKIFK